MSESEKTRRRLLFLCTGNSCRSQMAEGWLRSLSGDTCESLSAGANPAGYVHPNAIEVMKEAGADVGGQQSKHISNFLSPAGEPPDLIISVCSSTDENCPVFTATVERWHWPFDDPHYAKGSDKEKLQEFRRVRDEIRERPETQLIGK